MYRLVETPPISKSKVRPEITPLPLTEYPVPPKGDEPVVESENRIYAVPFEIVAPFCKLKVSVFVPLNNTLGVELRFKVLLDELVVSKLYDKVALVNVEAADPTKVMLLVVFTSVAEVCPTNTVDALVVPVMVKKVPELRPLPPRVAPAETVREPVPVAEPVVPPIISVPALTMVPAEYPLPVLGVSISVPSPVLVKEKAPCHCELRTKLPVADETFIDSLVVKFDVLEKPMVSVEVELSVIPAFKLILWPVMLNAPAVELKVILLTI